MVRGLQTVVADLSQDLLEVGRGLPGLLGQFFNVIKLMLLKQGEQDLLLLKSSIMMLSFIILIPTGTLSLLFLCLSCTMLAAAWLPTGFKMVVSF